MNDHERFSKQMEDTFKTLWWFLQNLNLSRAQKENLLRLVHDLRQFAFQAGRTEAAQQHSDE